MQEYKIPDNLRQEAKDYIEEVIKQLDENGVLASVDTAAINMLAKQYNIFVIATEELEDSDLIYTNSAGNLAPNPLLAIIKNSQAACFNLMKDFGLTAKSRTKLPQMQKDEDSPLLEFVKKQK